ncbi:MAG: Ig-like domain-containing protein, partial [Planctomycetota bacterium]
PGSINSTFPICLACPIYFSGSIVINNIQQSYTGYFDSMRPLMAMKGQVLPLSGADFFTTVYSLNAAVTSTPALSVDDIDITVRTDTTATWTPRVIDITLSIEPPTCRIINLPAHGTATVDTYCRSGTYTPEPGYLGGDSFTYQAAKGGLLSNLGTVSVKVIPGEVGNASSATGHACVGSRSLGMSDIFSCAGAAIATGLTAQQMPPTQIEHVVPVDENGNLHTFCVWGRNTDNQAFCQWYVMGYIE